MLQGFNLSLTVDPRVGPLFENLDLSIGDGEKVALVGRNGVGKTRLIRILAGLDQPSSGRCVLTDGSSVAYLPQDFEREFDGSPTDLYEDVPYHALARAASRVSLDSELLHHPYPTLSFGEKMKCALAHMLATEPRVLLLDEPTNHLDVVAKSWLTEFLVECHESVLLVCHDRAILTEVPGKIYEMTPRGLTEYTGNYQDMQEEKQETAARQRREWEVHQIETRRLKNAAEDIRQRAIRSAKKPNSNNYNAFAKGFYTAKQARVDKQATMVLGRVQKQIKDGPDKPFEADGLRFEFPTRLLRTGVPLHVRKLGKSFGDRVVLEDVNLTLENRSRLAIVGPNGCGKSTLLRILQGKETADEGEVEWSNDVALASMSQGRDALDPNLPAHIAAGGDPEDARTFLACLGMRGAVGERLVRNLSVGERTKVEIAAMVVQGANVLMLDEPTNHLDIPSVEALESALLAFPGIVIVVSHDKEFVERVATEVLILGG